MHSNHSKIMVAILLLLTVSMPITCLSDSGDERIYREPNSAQLIQAEQLFTWLFSQEAYKKAKEAALALGFTWRENKQAIHLTDQAKIGWGDYRFSKLRSNDIALMAPHRYHDKHTGVIAKRLLTNYEFSSIALNSIPRYSQTAENQSADLAHLSTSLHTAYSRAFAARFPSGKLIQLHGFSAQKRRTIAAQQADVILSNGTAWPSEYLLTLQRCLIQQDWKTLRYPQQVSELGGTQNSIGQLLRSLGHSGFIHMELNANSRQKLLNEKNTRSAFAHCLLGEAL